MNHKKSIKLSAFLLSGIMITQGTTGIIPGLNQSSILDNSILSAFADDTDGGWSQEKLYDNGFYFRTWANASKDGKYEAMIVGTSQYPTDLKIPSTVNRYINGKKQSYKVVKLSNIGYKKMETVSIPQSVTTLDNSFASASNLKTVSFTDKNGNTTNISGISKACKFSFNSQCPFIQKQKDKQSFSMVGNCLLEYYDSNNTPYKVKTLDLSDDKYDQIKYFGYDAFLSFSNLNSITLPKNLIGGNSAFYKNLEIVKYYDSSAKTYRDLVTYYNTKNAGNLIKSGIFGEDSKVSNQIINKLAEKIFSKKEVNIKFRGNVYSGYNAWEQYQIVHKLYTYIGKNYYHYDCNEYQSPDFLSEMIQTEVLGLKGESTRGIKCLEYAQLFEKLCILAGVEAKYVSTIEEDKHAFNIVKIGSQWFNLDCCWIGSTSTFLTPDSILNNDNINNNNIPNHRKDKVYSTYKCDRAIGDVNLDGKIDVADAQIIESAYVDYIICESTPTFSEVTKCRDINYLMVLCDVNRSGTIDCEDSQLLLNYYSEAVVNELKDRNGKKITNFEQYYWDQCGPINKNNEREEARWTQFLHPSKI